VQKGYSYSFECKSLIWKPFEAPLHINCQYLFQFIETSSLTPRWCLFHDAGIYPWYVNSESWRGCHEAAHERRNLWSLERFGFKREASDGSEIRVQGQSTQITCRDREAIPCEQRACEEDWEKNHDKTKGWRNPQKSKSLYDFVVSSLLLHAK